MGYERDVSVLERCVYWRDVCIRMMSVLRAVCIRETFVLGRCLH